MSAVQPALALCFLPAPPRGKVLVAGALEGIPAGAAEVEAWSTEQWGHLDALRAGPRNPEDPGHLGRPRRHLLLTQTGKISPAQGQGTKIVWDSKREAVQGPSYGLEGGMDQTRGLGISEPEAGHEGGARQEGGPGQRGGWVWSLLESLGHRMGEFHRD